MLRIDGRQAADEAADLILSDDIEALIDAVNFLVEAAADVKVAIKSDRGAREK